jgi:hypothetical protein
MQYRSVAQAALPSTVNLDARGHARHRSPPATAHALRPPAVRRVGFWTVLTGMTVLTGLTADNVVLVDSVHSVRCQHRQHSPESHEQTPGLYRFVAKGNWH